MRNHLFIDSLNALASDLDTKLYHLLTRHRKLSDLTDTLAMHLLDFKTALCQNLAKFITDCLHPSTLQNTAILTQTLQQLTKEINANNDRLFRYRLHHVLKHKAEKKRRESMINSSISSPRNEQLDDLEKSIVMIEKDLGIERENQENQNLAITRIISKSLLFGLDSTPISKVNPTDYSIISESGSAQIDLSSSQLSQQSQQSQLQEENFSNNIGLQSAQKTVPLPKKPNPLKKKKTNLGKTDAKQGLLGNLLEQTYSQCLDKV